MFFFRFYFPLPRGKHSSLGQGKYLNLQFVTCANKPFVYMYTGNMNKPKMTRFKNTFVIKSMCCFVSNYRCQGSVVEVTGDETNVTQFKFTSLLVTLP